MPKLNNIIFIICVSFICIIGINFINCNFSLPFSLYGNSLYGNIKKPLDEKCSESDKRAYDALFLLLNTVIALKTKMED
jgi:hypothetical protein